MKKSKSAANFVGKEKDPKLSAFDLSTSTAGNLDGAFLALSNLCLWFLHLQPNLKGHSVWWIESLKLQHYLTNLWRLHLHNTSLMLKKSFCIGYILVKRALKLWYWEMSKSIVFWLSGKYIRKMWRGYNKAMHVMMYHTFRAWEFVALHTCDFDGW